MPQKIDKAKEGTTERKTEEPAQPPATAFKSIRDMGYANYTFAKDFEYADLNTDNRPYPMAKKVNVMLIKENDGTANYIGLAFVGVLDDPLFLIVMNKAHAAECIKQINTDDEVVGLQFNGLTKHFGNVALVALQNDVYQKLADKLL